MIVMDIPLLVSYCRGFYNVFGWDHMMYGWGFPFLGFWAIVVWVVQIIVALFVYYDAKKLDKNGLLWLFLVILPWIGVLFLIMYLILRSEELGVKESRAYAQEVIDERYAKGEITRKEYLQIKEDIENKIK